MSREVVFFAHDDFANSKLNKALINEVKNTDIVIRDLQSLYGSLTFAQRINPAEEQKFIEGADKIILQFPFNWYSCPAIMTRFLADVLAFGFAYGVENPKTAGKKLLLGITTGGAEKDYKPNGYNNYYVTEFITGFIQTAKLCKMEFAGAFFVQGARVITDAELAVKSKEYIQFIKNA